MKRGSLAHAVQEHRGVCVPVVVPGEGPEPLDASRVPDGQHHVLAINAEERGAGVDAGGRGLSLVESVVSEAAEDRALADPQLPQQHHLVVGASVCHSYREAHRNVSSGAVAANIID